MAENEFDTREVNNCSQNGGFNETVCIDAQRVYDSCGDKDCLEDLEAKALRKLRHPSRSKKLKDFLD